MKRRSKVRVLSWFVDPYDEFLEKVSVSSQGIISEGHEDGYPLSTISKRLQDEVIFLAATYNLENYGQDITHGRRILYVNLRMGLEINTAEDITNGLYRFAIEVGFQNGYKDLRLFVQTPVVRTFATVTI
jgi:hypothetical protein